MRSAFAALFLAVLAMACSPSSDARDVASANLSQTRAGWTVLAYWVGDNDIDEWVDYNVRMMAEVGSSDSLQILLQAKRDPSRDPDGPANVVDVGPWKGTKRFKIERGHLVEVPGVATDANMSDPATLADFVRWGIETAPADHYAFVLWDHGGGWAGAGWDDLSNDHGDLPRLRKGLRDGLDQAGVKTFSLIDYDACFMASFEDVAAMQTVGDLMLASEHTEPGHGQDYAPLKMLADNRATTPEAFGRAMLDGYFELAKREKDARDVTMSLIDLRKGPALVDAMNELASVLATKPPVLMGRARNTAITYNVGNPGGFLEEYDLTSFANRLEALDPTMAPTSHRIVDAVANAVVYQRAGVNHAGSAGISITVPTKKQWNGYIANGYVALGEGLAEVRPWAQFLASYYRATANEIAPGFADAGHHPQMARVGSSLRVTGTLTTASGASVSQSTLYAGVVDAEGKEHYFFETTGSVDNANRTTSGWFDGYRISLVQGRSTQETYRITQMSADGSESITIPINYYANNDAAAERADIVVTYDASGNEVSRIFVIGNQRRFRNALPATSSFQVLAMVSENGGYDYEPVGPWFYPTSPLAIGWDPMAAGTAMTVELDAFNATGGSDRDIARFAW